MVKIKTFGKFGLVVDGNFFDIQFFRSQKARELFKLLVAYKDKKVSKEFIVNNFWPGMEFTKSKQNLNSTVYFIRDSLDGFFNKKGLGKEFVKSDSQFCWINFPEGFVCDFDLFKKEIKSAGYYTGEDKIVCLRKAIDIYEGDFIQEEYDVEWVKPFRKEYKEIAVNVIKEIIKQLKESGTDFDINTYIARLAEIDPLNKLDSSLVPLSSKDNSLKYFENKKKFDSQMLDGATSIVHGNKGAKFVSRQFFKDIVKLELSRRESGCAIINIKIKLGNTESISFDSVLMSRLSDDLRSGDIISLTEKNVFILLSTVDELKAVSVVKRIKRLVIEEYSDFGEKDFDFRLFRIKNNKIRKVKFENINVFN